MEISNEMMARIYHAYSDCDIEWSGNTYNSGNWIAQYPTLLHESKLLLHNLKNIIGEHAGEVARMANLRLHKEDELQQVGKDIANNVTSVFIDEPFLYNYVQIIDYLRSLGYDCGYGSIPSLIEAGIAVEIKSEGGGDGQG